MTVVVTVVVSVTVVLRPAAVPVRPGTAAGSGYPACCDSRATSESGVATTSRSSRS